MSRDISPDLRYLRLFFTQPHPCSYLPNQEAVTSFVDPDAIITAPLYSQLSRMGFRRSGKFLYAPNCGNCQACVACRVVADNFKASRSFRRCLSKGEVLSRHWLNNVDIAEHYPLFERYITARHADGDMYPASLEQYEDFLANGNDRFTGFVEFRHQGELIGCSVFDTLDDGLSAIYTYFDPDKPEFSIGTLAVLTLIQQAQKINLPYVYLGYWIEGCNKMNYKNRYQPLELYMAGKWLEA